MGLAEEEVLIRDDSGLLLDVGEARVPKSQEWTKKLTKTICLSLGFLVLGLCVAIPGPTLLDLEDQVKATTFEMMIVFASRSLGYLLGALIGGVLFDCFDKQLLLFCTLLVSSVATVAIPWSLTLGVMATMFALQGVTMGALDTGGNVFCIQLWGKKNPPFMQTLHFAFGIGAFIAPLLAKPFLSDSSIVYNTTSIVQGNIPVAPFAYEELHHNRTKRSHIFENPSFKNIKDDFFININNTSVLEHQLLYKNIERGYNLDRRRDPFEKLEYWHGRQKRQTGGGEDYTGIWKWKRHHPKRDSAPLVPDTPGTTTVKPGDIKTEISQNIPNADDPKVTGLVSDDKNNDASENVSDTDKDDMSKNTNENKEKPKTATPINSLSGVDLQTAKINNTIAANGSKVSTNVAQFKNDSSLSTNVSIVEPGITTMQTVNPPTTEEEIHKPSAATDEHRSPGSADGKDIAKHLDKSKAAIKESDSNTDEQNKDLEKEAVDTVDKNVNSTVPSVTKTLPRTNSSQVNITQSSSGEGNISTSAAVPIQTVQSTLNPQNSSEVKNSALKSTTVSSKKTSTTVPVKKPNTTVTAPSTATNTTSATKEKNTTPTTTPSTTTVRTTTTTPSTTTVRTTTTTPSTTTVRTTTTTPSTTTIVKTTMPTTKTFSTTTTTPSTTTMVKTTTPTTITTTAVGTTATTTLRPVTKGKTSGSVTNKGDHKPDTNEVTKKVKTTSSSTVKNASVVVTTPNVTLPDDLLSTTEVSHKPESAIDSLFNNAIHAVQNISKIQFAYLIIGLALFLISVIFLVLYCKDKRRLTTERDLDELERFKTGVTCAKATLIFLLGLFFFCYMGLEVTFGALVTTFAVDFNKWPKEQGAMAAAIFWGSLATGRGLSIFLARCCGPTVMLIFDLIFMVIGGLVLSIGVHFYDKLLWLGTLILGLGMSSAFPAGISWAEKYFHLTGKSTAVFVIGSAVGQMVIPVVTGYLYEHLGAIILMYSSLILSVITLVIFILMQCVALKRANLTVHERNGFLPLEDDDDADENLEMDDLVHFDKSQARMRRDKRGGGNAEYHTLISDLEDD